MNALHRPCPATPADDASAAGEEDPGAAMDGLWPPGPALKPLPAPAEPPAPAAPLPQPQPLAPTP